MVARDSVVTVDHPTAGPVSVSGVVPRLMETPGSIRRLGAVLGEASVDEILERWSTLSEPGERAGGDAGRREAT